MYEFVWKNNGISKTKKKLLNIPEVTALYSRIGIPRRLMITTGFFGIIPFRYFNYCVIDDNEKAWFPGEELKEFHGIVDHEVTAAENLLFCIRPDGREGLCCVTGNDDDDEN